jgi:spore coat protein U-like protein
MKTIHLIIATLLMSLTLPISASPHNNTYTVFIVDAIVDPACEVSSQAMSFTSFNPLAALGSVNGQASADIYVTCTLSTPYAIHLTESQNGTILARGMIGINSGTSINYQMFTDPYYSTIWGNGTSGTSFATGIGTGALQTQVVYGQLNAPPNTVTSDTYTDTIQITVIY